MKEYDQLTMDIIIDSTKKFKSLWIPKIRSLISIAYILLRLYGQTQLYNDIQVENRHTIIKNTVARNSENGVDKEFHCPHNVT